MQSTSPDLSSSGVGAAHPSHDGRQERGCALFLADASRLLAESLDYEPTLATVARLAMPELGAWCIVDLLEPDGSIRRVAIVHPDPARQALVGELQRGYPPDVDDPLGAPRVLRTRTAELIPEVTDQMLVRVARDERHLGILRALGMGSYMVVPLQARGRLLGCITFVSASEVRRYDATDLALAEDLALRCALAVDNARLYRDARAAREEAARLERIKSEFMAQMSHELRTPLNAIAGYTQLLALELQGPLTPPQRDAVERIAHNQRMLLRLVDDLLTFARAEAGRLPLDVADVPLDDTLSRVHYLVDPQLRASGVSYEYRPCDPAVVVRADRDKLQQIVVNLLSNAAKFTRAGGTVRLVARVVDDATAAVEVTDTGIGIEADKLEAIFLPFVQVSSGLTRTAEGAGLGLAISRQFARAMGGDLTATSVVGRGSTFTLTLPCVAAGAAGAAGAADAGPVSGAAVAAD